MQTKPTWRKVKLGEVVEINMGQSPRSEFYNSRGEGLPFYQGVTDFDEKYPKKSIYCSQPTKIAGAGDIFFSVRAPVGDVNVAVEKSCIGRGVAALRMKNRNNDFLYFLLKNYERYFKGVSGGTTYESINKDQIENIELLLPENPDDQKRIADILSSFDDKIELNNKISQTLEQMAQAIFKEWFVNFRFPGHEKIKMVDSELGKIPKGWEVKSWGELEGEGFAGDWGDDTESIEVSRKAYILRGTDIPALQAGSKGECPIRYLSDDSLKRRKLKPEDIVIEISGGSKGQPTGRSIIITQEILNRFELPIVCTSFCRLVRGNGILAPILMYLHLYRIYQTKKIWNYQLQSTGISNFQYGQFKEYERLVIPDKIVQEKITGTLYSYIEYGHLNENQKLAALRDLLLPKLMRGEIRV